MNAVSSPAPAPTAEHRAFSSFSNRDFRIYFFSATAAMMADNIEHVISYWVMFQKFHSPALGGFAVVSHWVPASQVLIHQIVRADQLPSAVRLSATGRYLGFLVGPAVGAGLLLLLGPAYGILVNAAIYAPVAGFVELAFNSMAQALVQMHAPNDMRGRVIGVFSMPAMGMRTFSGLSVGLLGARVGIHDSLALSAAVPFAVIATMFIGRLFRSPEKKGG